MGHIVLKTSSNVVLTLLLMTMFFVKTNAADHIPAAVEKAFIALYPNAEDVIWKPYENNQYMAVFIENEEEVNIFFNSKGELIETLRELNTENIPKRIQEKFKELPVGWKVNYVLKLTTAANFHYYRASVKFEKSYYEYIFDQDEKLVSVQTID